MIVLYILSIVLHIGFFIILRQELYTDRAMMADGHMREWHRSPIDRLYIADQPILLYLQLFFMAVSAIAALLLVFGVKNRIVRYVWIGGTAASVIVFIIILIVTSNIHAHYA